MGLTLYSATVPSFRQILGSVAGLISKAEAHCAEQGLAPAELIEARLAPDMLPFSFQIRSTANHSIGAIEGIRRGSYSPDRSALPGTFHELKQIVAAADAALAALDPAELDALADREVLFVAGERRLAFTGQDYLLSFAQPNFYFHATTAYDILRARGLPLGKRDYAGQLRVKR